MMHYISTRSQEMVTSAEAIARGIAGDGGLYVPESFPVLSADAVAKLIPMSYKERAKYLLSLFLTDYSVAEIDRCVEGAYTGNFDHDEPAPLAEVEKNMCLLELWHGPTCAFKDMALQLLPRLLTVAVDKVEKGKQIVILVATSGDTGKAALEGFADVPGTRIVVFYPCDGVSAMQKLQMITQDGANVAVAGIKGNFDDAQTGVKAIFADERMRALLAQHNMAFSSANSINFGRLVPQVVYYVSAWCDLIKTGKLQRMDRFNVVVPTGNFGNILAAYYAKQMGVPVDKFVCASNRNNVLTDFLKSGIYDRNRAFYATSSPSMDILISSNLERLLFHVSGGDGAMVSHWMKQLSTSGKYAVSDEVRQRIQSEFFGGFCDEESTRRTIGELFEKDHYLCDPHTAVAVDVYRQYAKQTGDRKLALIASTASAYKFAPAVLPAVYVG
ncbi:MAG: threonine synthase, partial [Victivallaceae bacterium]|nr:threonine synthase [Victivallaceae bacterium]